MQDDKRLTRPDALEEGIDAALRTYLEPPDVTEPRIAAARLLERARSEPRRRSMGWFWAVAVPACAVLIAAIVALWMLRAPHVPQIALAPKAPGVVATRMSKGEPSHTGGPTNGPASRNPRNLPARVAANHRRIAPPTKRLALAPSRQPKLPVFPTPRPLSPQEQALLAFAQRGPADVRRAVLEDQQHWDKPIIVAGVHEHPSPAVNQQDQ